MFYQLAGFGTLNYIVSKTSNWTINIGILGLIAASTLANRQEAFERGKTIVLIPVAAMVIMVFYGVFKLRRMQVN